MVRSIVVVIVVMSLLESSANADAAKLEGVVNLNTASMDELRLLPGVGPARVRNILAYRRAHPFRTVDELARIQGIGRKTVRRLRLHLAVSGPSTAQRVIRPDLPFVGPPPVAPAPTVPRGNPHGATTASVLRPLGPTRPSVRRGEPAHAASLHARGNSCLPPP
jgi:competence protein ComEA